MAGEADQIPRVTDKPIIYDRQSDSEMESNVAATSSSSNVATMKMVEKTIPEMVDY
jgi:hypothetical protein